MPKPMVVPDLIGTGVGVVAAVLWFLRDDILPVEWPATLLFLYVSLALLSLIRDHSPEPTHGRTYLVAIPHSHYSELARWALQRHGVSFVEWGFNSPLHVGLVARLRGQENLVQTSVACPPSASSAALDARRQASLPLCITPRGRVLVDSWEILNATAGSNGASPDASVKTLLDSELGPAARMVLMYNVGIPNDCSRGRAQDDYAGPLHRIVAPVYSHLLHPVIEGLMRKHMCVSAAAGEQALATCRRIFNEVGTMLGGREYLGGSQPGAADFAFAALAKGLIGPDDFDEGPTELMQHRWRLALGEVPPKFQGIVTEFRGTAAGQLVLRMYKRHRREVVTGGAGQLLGEEPVPPEERHPEQAPPSLGRCVFLAVRAIPRAAVAYVAMAAGILLWQTALTMLGFTSVNDSTLGIPMQRR